MSLKKGLWFGMPLDYLFFNNFFLNLYFNCVYVKL